jgi:fructosamine-3-kinase
MTRQPLVAKRAEELLGSSVVSTAPVAGGDIATATRLRLSSGQTALMKTLAHAPEGFFEAEAAGLRWLAEVADGVPVPDVLAASDDCVILAWVEPTSKHQPEAAIGFGHALAATHLAGAAAYGATHDGFIGRLPMPNKTCPTWPEFYAVRRVLPYLKLARDRGAVTDGEAATIESVIGRLPGLIPDEAPARLHGDLWNGNCLWGLDGSTSSTPRPTADTARPTWRCCTSSACRTCPA